MKRLGIAIVLLVASLISLPPVHAQGPLQVWYVSSDGGEHPVLEYRDSAGNVLASFVLVNEALEYGHAQANGRLYGADMKNLAVFDPYQGAISMIEATGAVTTSEETYASVMGVVPGPNNTVLYGVTTIPQDYEQPSTNRFYQLTPGSGAETLLLEAQTENFTALQPLALGSDGATLVYHEMPQGIGGYILFWTYRSVRTLNINTQAIELLGDLDGFSADLNQLAVVTRDDSSVTGLSVTDRTTGQQNYYPLPILGEQVQTGGNAYFSPGNTKVAYQVARSNPENEQFWTIVVDLASGTSHIAYVDTPPPGSDWGEVVFGHLTGWLDENTLVLGSAWRDSSALIDVNRAALMQEVPGVFLGLAEGVTSTQGFAPNSVVQAQCPGAPVSRMQRGTRGRITFTDGSQTNVRQWPELTAEIAGTQSEGAEFTVTGGPTCIDGYAWWQLMFDEGPSGWVAEGIPGSYWLEPWQ